MQPLTLKKHHAFGLLVAVGVALGTHAARAQCLTGGVINVCDDPLNGKEPSETLFGGTVLANGFRIDQKGDHVTFDFGGSVSTAAIRFTLSNVGPATLDQDTHLVLLATDTPTLKNPAPTRVLELKIWGDAVDPTVQGTTRFGVGDATLGLEAEKSAGKLTWQASATYRIDVSWDDATQHLRFVREAPDGTKVVVDFHTGDAIPGSDNPPLPLQYRYVHLAMPYLSNNAFWPVVKSVYGMVSIAATPTAMTNGTGGSGTTSSSATSSSATTSSSGSGEGAGGASPDTTGSGASAAAGGATLSSGAGGAGGTPTGPDAHAVASESAADAESGGSCSTTGRGRGLGLPLAALIAALVPMGWARRRRRAARILRSR